MNSMYYRWGVGLGLVGLLAIGASAKERSRGGTYQGTRGSGSWSSKTSRTPGQMKRSTSVETPRGTAQREVERNYDKNTGKGSYSSQTTGPAGKSVSRQGTVEKTGEGTFHQEGTITGPQGKTTNVDRTSTKNENGTRSVNTTFTNEQGQTLNVEKTITKTEDGRVVEGAYQSSTGKGGTFQSETTRQDGKVTTEKTVTNQEGKTIHRSVESTKTDTGIHRDIRSTNAEGETKERSVDIGVSTQTVTP